MGHDCLTMLRFSRAAAARRSSRFPSKTLMLVSKEKREQIRQAIHSHDFLHRIMRQVEHLHRVVFHQRVKGLDLHFIRASAEEILIADILTRHEGNIDGVYFALRKVEDGGRSWQHAISEYSAYIHNYYT